MEIRKCHSKESNINILSIFENISYFKNQAKYCKIWFAYGSRVFWGNKTPITETRFKLISKYIFIGRDSKHSNELTTAWNAIVNCLFCRFPEQKSERIHLKKGKYYYLEAYQKSDKLADCVSVAVELPSGHFEGPIKRVHLSWRLPGEW